MHYPRTLLEDTFTFQTVPFLVKVERKEMYVHADTDEVRGVNMYGAPTGLKSGSRKWVICDCIVATVRPDYPYTIEQEWPENVDKHHSAVEPLEVPKKRGWWLLGSYTAADHQDPGNVSERALAEQAAKKLKQAYESRREVKEL